MKGEGLIRFIDRIICDNVYWVEGLNFFFLSVVQLNNLGYIVEFQHKRLRSTMDVVNWLEVVIKQEINYSIWVYLMIHAFLENMVIYSYGIRFNVMWNLTIWLALVRWRNLDDYQYWINLIMWCVNNVNWEKWQSLVSRERHIHLMIFWNWFILTFVDLLEWKSIMETNISFYLLMPILEWWLWCFLK